MISVTFQSGNLIIKKLLPQNVFVRNTGLELKFFESIDDLEVKNIFKRFELNIAENQTRWKVAFIFFMVIPFTGYEFLDSTQKLLDPNDLSEVVNIQSSNNILIKAFPILNL